MTVFEVLSYTVNRTGSCLLLSSKIWLWLAPKCTPDSGIILLPVIIVIILAHCSLSKALSACSQWLTTKQMIFLSLEHQKRNEENNQLKNEPEKKKRKARDVLKNKNRQIPIFVKCSLILKPDIKWCKNIKSIIIYNKIVFYENLK